MPISTQGQQLNGYRLHQFKELFTTQPPLLDTKLSGRFRAEFVGPGWLRQLAPPALAIGGLRGWWGKACDGAGNSVNLVQQGAAITPRLPMQLTLRPSLLDGQTNLVLSYPPGSPFPWPWVVDELRWLDANAILGMTMATKAGLWRVAFPFLLLPV